MSDKPAFPRCEHPYFRVRLKFKPDSVSGERFCVGCGESLPNWPVTVTTEAPRPSVLQQRVWEACEEMIRYNFGINGGSACSDSPTARLTLGHLLRELDREKAMRAGEVPK